VTWVDLDSLAFILHILTHFWIVSRLVYSLCDAMVGSLSVTTTAVSSAKVCRSAVYSRYSNGPKILPWGTSTFMGKSSVCSFSILMRKCLLVQVGF
jgi:hypothetical protein